MHRLTSDLGVLGALVLLAAGAGGCVIPLAPEFEQERNVPPFVKQANPEEGTMVTDRNQVFQVVVEDPNRADNLHIAWMIDYPPYVENITVPGRVQTLPSPGVDKANEHIINHQPRCEFDPISPSSTQHRLMLVVADRAFLPPPDAGPLVFDRVPPGAHILRVVWFFEKECK